RPSVEFVLVLQEGPVLSMQTGPLLALRLDRRQPLGLQIERQIRDLIRAKGLPVGSELPSTRVLAADLGVSRGVVVGAYAQLAAEGYLVLRRGTAATVADVVVRPGDDGPGRRVRDVPISDVRFNLRPDLPDLSLFPRSDWL